jgi:hypothetical protein
MNGGTANAKHGATEKEIRDGPSGSGAFERKDGAGEKIAIEYQKKDHCRQTSQDQTDWAAGKKFSKGATGDRRGAIEHISR